jgi:hypothetical protein
MRRHGRTQASPRAYTLFAHGCAPRIMANNELVGITRAIREAFSMFGSVQLPATVGPACDGSSSGPSSRLQENSLFSAQLT